MHATRAILIPDLVQGRDGVLGGAATDAVRHEDDRLHVGEVVELMRATLVIQKTEILHPTTDAHGLSRGGDAEQQRCKGQAHVHMRPHERSTRLLKKSFHGLSQRRLQKHGFRCAPEIKHIRLCMISPGHPWPGISRGLKESFNALPSTVLMSLVTDLARNLSSR